MKIHVGSKNQTKIDAVTEAVKLYPYLFPDAEVTGVPIEIELYGHPKNLKETVEGAIDRAHQAFPGSSYSFGIEGGLIEVPFTKSGYMETGVCAVYDGKEIYLGLGPSFEWPKAVTEMIVQGKADASKAFKLLELTEHEKLGAAAGGITGFLTDGRFSREKHSLTAIMMALMHLDKPELYK